MSTTWLTITPKIIAGDMHSWSPNGGLRNKDKPPAKLSQRELSETSLLPEESDNTV